MPSFLLGSLYYFLVFVFLADLFDGVFMIFCLAAKAMDAMKYTMLKGRPMRIMWSVRNPQGRRNGSGNLFVKVISIRPIISVSYRFLCVRVCFLSEEFSIDFVFRLMGNDGFFVVVFVFSFDFIMGSFCFVGFLFYFGDFGSCLG